MVAKWTYKKAHNIIKKPFLDLIFKAQKVHRKHFEPNKVQVSTLLSIKTGNCPENCSYCPQSARYNTQIKKEPLLKLSDVSKAAKRAKEMGSTRFCMGAAWRGPREKDLKDVCEMISHVKELGLETCGTFGLLNEEQALKLKRAGLDFYNHNIDTSKEFYDKIITTRTFEDRLKTLGHVRKAKLKVCSGGILGMGESNIDRINMLVTLANLEEPPESLPINKLIRIPGTPLEGAKEINSLDFIRAIALSRIMMPRTFVRLSAGREQMSQEMQTLCFLAGANSIFCGEKLLTAKNPLPSKDEKLFQDLGLEKMC